MFRWCAYCQHFIGESEPLLDYQITHGICESCLVRVSALDTVISKDTVLAQKFYNQIFAAALENDQARCRELLQVGLEKGFNGSDLAVGLIQPALYKIGKLWEDGLISVAFEHEFTAWCDELVSNLLSARKTSSNPVDFLIVPLKNNTHTLGSKIVSLFLSDHGYHSSLLDRGLPDNELLSHLEKQPPRSLGISVALPEMIPSASRLWLFLKERLQIPVFFGGFAFRQPGTMETLDPALTARVILTADAALKHMQALSGSAPRV